MLRWQRLLDIFLQVVLINGREVSSMTHDQVREVARKMIRMIMRIIMRIIRMIMAMIMIMQS